MALVETSARSREDSADAQLLAVFDVLDDLFRRGDRNARIFVEALATIGRGGALTDENAVIEAEFRALVDTLTGAASVPDGEGFALSFRLLLNGAILKSIRGDHDASLRAKTMAEDLLARHATASLASTATAHPVAAGSWTSLDVDAYASAEVSWF